ncbi:S41 family peptidase [soil metagenome]
MPGRLPKLSIVLAALLPTMLALGIWLGGHPRWLPDPIADVLLGDDSARVVSEGLDLVEDRYYRKVDDSTLTNAALKGAIDKLDDRFSAYLTPGQYGLFRHSVNNSFSGVGLAIRGVARGLRVQTVYPRSPAERADIRVGDTIVAVNGASLKGVPERAATARIKGRPGTKVTLTVLRGRKRLTKRLTRAQIQIPIVESKIRRAEGEPLAHIALSTFGAETADDQMAAAIRRAKRRKAKGIVLDLRDNGGGLITQAQLIASMFLSDGAIVTTRGRAVEQETLNALGQPIAGKLPTVVLVNGATASASEIVAGALQDRKRALLVGTRTFGKGVFQEVLPLANGGALDITVGQYFLPSGRNLGGAGTKPGSGLKPDVTVRDDPKTKRDEALDQALETLASRL